jgi:hypothetical protein
VGTICFITFSPAEENEAIEHRPNNQGKQENDDQELDLE